MSRTKGKGSGRLVRVLLVIALLLMAVDGLLGYIVWSDCQEVFHDVTVELGAQSLSIRDFMTEQAKPRRVKFVTDPSVIDLNKVGQTPVTLKHGTQVYTLTLTVEDTTAPAARIDQQYTLSVEDPLPEAGTLVHDIQDESKVRVYYAQEPVVPEDYSATTVTVVVEDASGNRLTQDCEFHYGGWLKETCTLEYGQQLTPEMLLVNPEKDGSLLDPLQLMEAGSSVGEHTVTVESGGSKASCTVTVQDTTPPVLKLQNVRRKPKESVSLKDFVVTATDLTGTPQLRVVGDEPSSEKKGTYTIVVEAEDAYGNVAKKEATLWVSSNLNPPEIKGASKELTMEKNAPPDFLKGVYAADDIDKNVEIAVDTSGLDVSKAGTYFITYSAVDSSGNTGTLKRKVIVQPDDDDAMAMVKEIADTLPDDPEAIRDWVRDNIAYNSNWGGDNPVWYGLSTRTGNCFVHANTLKAFLDYKGYETQLIWVKNESHYWLIIKLPEGWRHIDSTPSYQHRKISLMTDKERYLNLNGRNWDRSKWPKCE